MIVINDVLSLMSMAINKIDVNINNSINTNFATDFKNVFLLCKPY